MAIADFTTLANVKEYLGIVTTATKDDSLLGKLISRASSFICNYCTTTFLLANYTEQRDGNDSMRLMLRNLPVAAVTALTIDGQAIPPGGNSQKNGFWCDDTFVYVKGYRFNRGMCNINVAYSAGFATLPTDIEDVCINMVANKYKRKDRIGKVSEGMAGQQTNYSTSDLSAEDKKALQSYKRVGLA